MNTLTDRILFTVTAIVAVLFSSAAAVLIAAPDELIAAGILRESVAGSVLLSVAPFAFAAIAVVWTGLVALPAYRQAFRFGVSPSERFRVSVLPPVEYGRGGGAAQFFVADIDAARHIARTVLNCAPSASVTIADRYTRETTRTETTRHTGGAPVSLRALSAAIAAVAFAGFGAPAFAASGEPSGAAVTGGFAFACIAAVIAAGSLIIAARHTRRRPVRRALSVCGAAVTAFAVSVLFTAAALSAPETGVQAAETPLYGVVILVIAAAVTAVSFAAGFAPVRRFGVRAAAVWTETIWRIRRAVICRRNVSRMARRYGAPSAPVRRLQWIIQDIDLHIRTGLYRRRMRRNVRRAAPSAIARIESVQAYNTGGVSVRIRPPRRPFGVSVRRAVYAAYAAIRRGVRTAKRGAVKIETAIWRVRRPHIRIRWIRERILSIRWNRRKRAVIRGIRRERRAAKRAVQARRIRRAVHAVRVRILRIVWFVSQRHYRDYVRSERAARRRERRAAWTESVRRNGGYIAACIAALPDGVKIRIYRAVWFVSRPSYRTYLKNIRMAKRIHRHNTRNAARRNVSACIAAVALSASGVPAYAAAPDIAAAAAFVFAPFAAVAGSLAIAFAASAAVRRTGGALRRVRRTVWHTFAAERRTPPPPPSGFWPALRRAGYIAAYGIPFVLYVRVRRAVLAYVSAYVAARFPSGQLMSIMEPALSAHTVRAYAAVYVQALYRRWFGVWRRFRRETRQFMFYAVRRAAVQENTGALQRAINTRRRIRPYSSVWRRIRRAVLIAAYGIPSAVHIRIRRVIAAYVANYIRERFLFADIRRLLDAPIKGRTIRAYAAAYVSARLQLRRERRAVRRRYGKQRRTVTMRILSAAGLIAAASAFAASGEPSGVPAFAAVIAAAPFGIAQLRRGASVIIGSDAETTAADMARRIEPFRAAAAAYVHGFKYVSGIGAYTMESGETVRESIGIFYADNTVHTETMADIAAAYCRRYVQESYAVIRRGAPELRYLAPLPNRIRRVEKWTDIIYAPPETADELRREYGAAHTVLPDGAAFAFAVPLPPDEYAAIPFTA